MRARNVRRLWFLGLLGLLFPLDDFLEPFRFFFLFFFVPVVVDLAVLGRKVFSRKGNVAREHREPPVEVPLPGPAARGGPLRFHLRYLVSSTLALLNPLQLAQTVKQAKGQTVALRRREGALPEADTYVQRVEYTLPFRGEWLVLGGGVTPETSHSWDLVAQRYAYDFVVAGEHGQRHRGDGSRKEDYFAYGQPVLAPADGVVVHIRDGVRDAPEVGTGWVDWLSRDFRGCSVTLRHADEEYSFLAHLVPGSIRVRPGDRVHRGQEVGRCGNSGHSTEPHLHFQVQDHPDFYHAVGVPVRFSGVRVRGDMHPFCGYLAAGARVEPSGKLVGPNTRRGFHDHSD